MTKNNIKNMITTDQLYKFGFESQRALTEIETLIINAHNRGFRKVLFKEENNYYFFINYYPKYILEELVEILAKAGYEIEVVGHPRCISIKW